MTKAKKYTIISVLTLIGLYMLVLLIAFTVQKNIHNNYGISFNDERIKLGIHPIGFFQSLENNTWKDFYSNDPIKRWSAILLNTEIANITTYSNPNIDDKPYQKQKQVFYGTHLFFWQNFHGGEIDLFIKPIDDERHIELMVIYYSETLVPQNYFYYSLDTVYKESAGLMICGTPFIEDEQTNGNLPEGNITKEQAQKLIAEWEIK